MSAENIDMELIKAFSLLDISNFRWLTDKEMEAEKKNPFKPVKKGYMSVPLNKDTFEDMRRASIFKGDWRTDTKKVMNKKRRFRIEIRMYAVGSKHPIQAIAVMIKPDTVHTLWKAVGEGGGFIKNEKKGTLWDQERCRAVIKV